MIQVLSNICVLNPTNPSSNPMNPTNLKVLHIIDSGGLYGAEVMLLNLVAEQIKLGIDPTIASIGENSIKEKPIEAETLKKNFKLKIIRMRPGPNYFGAMKVLNFAHNNGFDLMHSHGYKGNILFGFMPKSIRRLPLVSTLHGWTSTNGISKMKIYEWLDRKSLRFIDAVVLVSEGMKFHPKLKHLDSKNTHIIPNGIPISDCQFDDFNNRPINESSTQPSNHSTNQQFDQSATQQTLDQRVINFCQKGFTIGSIGRLSAEKGYKYLIEALRLLIKEGFDARLIIIGEGDERENLERLAAQYNLSNRVLMPGYKEDAKQYLPFIDIYAISSLTEGLPLTLLETMQAKVPIVASKVGGIPEVLDNGRLGLLVKPCKINALAEAISLIFNDKRFVKQMTNAAYHKVTSYYASKNMASRYLDIYKEIIPISH